MVLEAGAEPPASLRPLLVERLEFLGARGADVFIAGTQVRASWRGGPDEYRAADHLEATGDFVLVPVLADEQKRLLGRYIDPEVAKALPAGVEAGHEGTPERRYPTLIADDAMMLWSILPSELSAGSRWLAVETQDQPIRWASLLVRSQPIVSTADVVRGEIETTWDKKPAIAIFFTPEAAARLEKESARLVGKQVCVVVDGRVFSCPAVAEPLKTGKLLVLLPDSVKDAAPLLTALVHGPLPVRLTANLAKKP
jgi:hypothetical protein